MFDLIIISSVSIGWFAVGYVTGLYKANKATEKLLDKSITQIENNRKALNYE